MGCSFISQACEKAPTPARSPFDSIYHRIESKAGEPWAVKIDKASRFSERAPYNARFSVSSIATTEVVPGNWTGS